MRLKQKLLSGFLAAALMLQMGAPSVFAADQSTELPPAAGGSLSNEIGQTAASGWRQSVQ